MCISSLCLPFSLTFSFFFSLTDSLSLSLSLPLSLSSSLSLRDQFPGGQMISRNEFSPQHAVSLLLSISLTYLDLSLMFSCFPGILLLFCCFVAHAAFCCRQTFGWSSFVTLGTLQLIANSRSVRGFCLAVHACSVKA